MTNKIQMQLKTHQSLYVNWCEQMKSHDRFLWKNCNSFRVRFNAYPVIISYTVQRTDPNRVDWKTLSQHYIGPHRPTYDVPSLRAANQLLYCTDFSPQICCYSITCWQAFHAKQTPYFQQNTNGINPENMGATWNSCTTTSCIHSLQTGGMCVTQWTLVLHGARESQTDTAQIALFSNKNSKTGTGLPLTISMLNLFLYCSKSRQGSYIQIPYEKVI